MPLDIDLHAFLYDDAGQLIEMVWYKNLRDISQNIRHHGDEQLGKKSPSAPILHYKQTLLSKQMS